MDLGFIPRDWFITCQDRRYGVPVDGARGDPNSHSDAFQREKLYSASTPITKPDIVRSVLRSSQANAMLPSLPFSIGQVSCRQPV